MCSKIFLFHLGDESGSYDLSPVYKNCNYIWRTFCSNKYFKNEPKIKWPNDLLVENEKLAGILIKNIVKTATIKDTIVGIGMNVNQLKFKDYFPPATSMKKLLEKNFALADLQKELLDCIAKRYLQLKQGKAEKMKSEYLAILYGFNNWKDYKIGGRKIKAKIMADGNIKCNESEGSIHKVAAKIIGAESCNGWTYWHYNLDGAFVPIDNLRQRLISKNALG